MIRTATFILLALVALSSIAQEKERPSGKLKIIQPGSDEFYETQYIFDFESYNIELYKDDTLYERVLSVGSYEEIVDTGWYNIKIYPEEHSGRVFEVIHEVYVLPDTVTIMMIADYNYTDGYHSDESLGDTTGLNSRIDFSYSFHYSQAGIVKSPSPARHGVGLGLNWRFIRILGSHHLAGLGAGAGLFYYHIPSSRSITPDISRFERYFHFPAQLDAFYGITGYPADISHVTTPYYTGDQNGLDWDVGARYCIPVAFRHVYLSGNQKIVSRRIHEFTDFRLFSRIGYVLSRYFKVDIEVSYRPLPFIESPFPELPQWTLGVNLTQIEFY